MFQGRQHHHHQHSSIKDDYRPLLNYYRKRDAQLNPQHHQHDSEDDALEHSYKPYHPSAHLSRSTSNEDLATLTRAADVVRAEHDLINRRVHNNLAKTVLKSDDAIRMSKHFQNHQNNSDDDNESTDSAIAEQQEFLRKVEAERLLRIKRRMDMNRDKDFSDDFKRSIRGQSPNTIADAILAESERNIKAGRKDEREFVAHALSVNMRSRPTHHHLHHRPLHTAAEYHHHRPLSLTEHHYRPVHSSLSANDNLIEDFDYKISSELRNVRRDLSKLSTRTSDFYADSKVVPRISPFQSSNLPRRYEYESLYTVPPPIRNSISPRPWLSQNTSAYRRYHQHYDHIAINSTSRKTGPGTNIYSYRNIH